MLTGARGFLGRRILFFLKKKKYKIYYPNSKILNLENIASAKKFLKKHKKDIDVIIHSAVYYGGIGTNKKYPADLILKNNLMTNTVYYLAKELNVKKIISVGSACAWPGDKSGDLHERDVFNGRPHDSVEAYGFNKRVHLVFNKAYYKQYGIKSNQLALANLYGENDVFTEERSHVISSFIKKVYDAKYKNSTIVAWGTGKPIRQFIHVDDAAKIIVKSINFKSDLSPINVYGEEISIKNLLKLICEIYKFDMKDKINWNKKMPDGITRKVLAKGKLKKILPNYKLISFKKGLKKTIDWYIKNYELANKRK